MKIRALTEIEEAVIRKILNKAIENFRDAWVNVIKLKPQLEAIETNPQFTQIVPPSDMVVIVTLQVKIGKVEGLINVCIPYLVLEPIMSKLTTTFWVASSVAKQDHPEQIELLQEKIRKTVVPVSIELGSINITIQEFLTLGFGDVLQLDTKVSDELKLFVGKRPKFFCRPGTSGKKAAVQITRVMTEGDEGDDEG